MGNGVIARRLVTRVLNDAGDDPDQLPIMQHALMRTWDHWNAREHGDEPVDLADYEAVGGMAQALSRHADEAYGALDPRGQEIARRMFQRLTAKGADHREVRRAANVSTLREVTGASADELANVITEFRKPGRSFLMPPETVALELDPPIDISHESLIRRWDRLAKWVDEEAEAAKAYQRLAETARLHAQGRAGLWGDPDLASSLAWKERVQPTLAWAQRYDSDFEQAMAFLEESKAERDAAARRRQREHRMVVGAVTATIVGLALLSGAAIWSWHEARVKQVEAREARDDVFQVSAVARNKLTQVRNVEIDSLGDLMNWAPPSWLGYLYRQRASWRMEAGDVKRAQRDIEFALEQDPDFLPAFITASNVYMVAGDADAAVDYARAYLAVNRANAAAAGNLVLALAMRREYEASIAAIDDCLAHCYLPIDSSEDVNAPDIEEITQAFKMSMRDSDFLLALRYTKAFVYALAGDARFRQALDAADKSDPDFPESSDAYLGALNWQWMILRGQVLNAPKPEAGDAQRPMKDIADYGAYAMRAALWARIAATRPAYEVRAEDALNKFRAAYKRDQQARYKDVAGWVESAPTKMRARDSAATTRAALDEARRLELQADDLYNAQSAMEPIDFAPALLKLTRAIDGLRASGGKDLGRRGQDLMARLLSKRAGWRLEAKDRTGAAQDAREATEVSPNSAEAHRLLASALFDRNQSVAEYKKALAIDAFNGTALRELSGLIEDEDPAQALALVRRRQLVVSRSSIDHEIAARINAKQKQYDDAVASIRAALAIHPWRTELLDQQRELEIRSGVDQGTADIHLAAGLRRIADYYARTGENALAMSFYVRAFTRATAASVPTEKARPDIDAIMRNLSGFLSLRYGRDDASNFWAAVADNPVLSEHARELARAERGRLGP